MAGVFMGDYVKGTVTGRFPRDIALGIQFHRTVDAHVDAHQIQKQSVSRLPKHLRRYGSIICDVVYDHYLAKRWQEFCHAPLDRFCQTSYEQILRQSEDLTHQAETTITRMAEHQALEGYQSKHYIERTLAHISRRFKHQNPLAEAYGVFEQLESDLEQDFLAFLPEVDAFAAGWLEQRLNAEPQRY